jgi:hypothetical protein
MPLQQIEGFSEKKSLSFFILFRLVLFSLVVLSIVVSKMIVIQH